MTPNLTIQRATIDHTHEVVALVGELFKEVNMAIGMDAFNFDHGEASLQFKEFINQGKYVAFIARGQDASAIGLVSFYESYALSAGGVFGTLAELYVRPAYRSQGVGHHLIEQVKAFGQSCHWKLLQVTTPPLPQFDRTLAFYEREGFVVTGGRKLQVLL